MRENTSLDLLGDGYKTTSQDRNLLFRSAKTQFHGYKTTSQDRNKSKVGLFSKLSPL